MKNSNVSKPRAIVMSRPNNVILQTSLIVLFAILLTGCSTTSSKTLPAWPKAGSDTAIELIDLCQGPDLPNCPNIADWLQRLDKFKRQVDVAR